MVGVGMVGGVKGLGRCAGQAMGETTGLLLGFTFELRVGCCNMF